MTRMTILLLLLILMLILLILNIIIYKRWPTKLVYPNKSKYSANTSGICFKLDVNAHLLYKHECLQSCINLLGYLGYKRNHCVHKKIKLGNLYWFTKTLLIRTENALTEDFFLFLYYMSLNKALSDEEKPLLKRINLGQLKTRWGIPIDYRPSPC